MTNKEVVTVLVDTWNTRVSNTQEGFDLHIHIEEANSRVEVEYTSHVGREVSVELTKLGTKYTYYRRAYRIHEDNYEKKDELLERAYGDLIRDVFCFGVSHLMEFHKKNPQPQNKERQ